MSEVYSDEEREEAIEAAAMMASSNALHFDHPIGYLGDAIDTDSRAATLLRACLWDGDYGADDDENGRMDWADTEAALRMGWTPSDGEA